MQQRECPELQACIEICQNCHHLCIEAAMNTCLETGGKHVEPGYFRLLADCAEICRTTADFMLRHSDYHDQLCLECATLCDYCAAGCQRLEGMKDCAQACRDCADCCHQVAFAMA